MRIQNPIQLSFRNPQFRKRLQTNPQNAELNTKSNKDFSTPPNVSPAYFHPAFTGKLDVKKFSKLLDTAIANPEKVQPETLTKLEALFGKIFDPWKMERINDGKRGVVFKINEKYVVKVLKNEHPNTKNFQLTNNEIGNKLNTWYGGIVAKTENISILKNAAGDEKAQPYGAPYRMYMIGMSSRKDIIDYYKTNSLPKLKQMPQEAFDEVAKDFKILNGIKSKKGYYYTFETFNPNNVLLLNDKIRLVDDLEKIKLPNSNNLSLFLTTFINRIHALSSGVFDKEIVPERKAILKKCMIASEKAKLPISMTESDMFGVDRVLKLINVKTRSKTFIHNIDQIRKNCPNMDQRLEAIGQYVDNLH